MNEAIELLKKIEWQKGDYDMGLRGCNICGQMEEIGHAEDCELAKALAALEKPCECEHNYTIVHSGLSHCEPIPKQTHCPFCDQPIEEKQNE